MIETVLRERRKDRGEPLGTDGPLVHPLLRLETFPRALRTGIFDGNIPRAVWSHPALLRGLVKPA